MAGAGATSPSACALAVALPSSVDDVKADLELPGAHDWAKAMRGAAAVYSPEGVWEAHFRPAVDAFEDYCPELEGAGVTIVRAARLSDLAPLLEGGFQTVTILTHWKGHEVWPADVLDCASIVREIGTSQSKVCAKLRLLMAGEALAGLESAEPLDGDEARIGLAKVLTEAIESGQLLFDVALRAGEHLAITPAELCEFNRQQVDIWFPRELVAGNRLELRDGLFSASEVAGVIPERFSGCLHLANCRSTLLQRTLSSPRWRVLANETSMLPLPFLEIYRTVVEQLGPDRPGYCHLWFEVLKATRGADLSPHSPWRAMASRLARRWRNLIGGVSGHG